VEGNPEGEQTQTKTYLHANFGIKKMFFKIDRKNTNKKKYDSLKPKINQKEEPMSLL
jgi:hypothetical protein